MRITRKGYEVLCHNCFVVSRHWAKEDRMLFMANFSKVLYLSFENFDTDKFREAFNNQE